MEQTIGKRIAALRKSRGMTQEQLAERAGVSAQAVSKWENDISCPDISLLPRLAETFGVTTDHLLGAAAAETPVKQGFHINLGEDPGDEPDETENGFTLRLDPGRDGFPWFAVALLLFGVSLLLNRTLLAPLGESSVWNLLWPSAVLTCGIGGLCKRVSAGSISITCFGACALLVKLGVLNRVSWFNWRLVFPVLLILLAVELLVEHFRRE